MGIAGNFNRKFKDFALFWFYFKPSRTKIGMYISRRKTPHVGEGGPDWSKFREIAVDLNKDFVCDRLILQ